MELRSARGVGRSAAGAAFVSSFMLWTLLGRARGSDWTAAAAAVPADTFGGAKGESERNDMAAKADAGSNRRVSFG